MSKSNKELAAQVEGSTVAPVDIDTDAVLHRRNLLSTGSTLLNKSLSGNPFGGFAKGKYYFMVGDSMSGKTFLSMTCFAEAAINRQFKDYRFIYDNIEDGMLMNTDALFGMEVSDRMEPPARTKEGQPRFSRIAEDFYYHLDDAIAEGRPFIYVLDSMDALDSEAADKKFDQLKKARRKALRKEEGEVPEKGEEKDEKVAGSYGDGKAKINSASLRKMIKGLKDTGSILIIISQTRDNIGGYGGKTRGGGHALRFYATTEFWSNVVEQIKKKVHDKDRKVGIRVRVSMKKNRLTGKLYDVEMDIYPSYGIDDLGSCVDYLLEEGWWTKEKQSVKAGEWGFVGTRERLISYIEQNERQSELQAIVGQCWDEIDAACSLQRKPRYGAVAEAP